MSQETWGSFVIPVNEERMMEIVPNEFSTLKQLYDSIGLSYKYEMAMEQEDYLDELRYTLSEAIDEDKHSLDIIHDIVDAWSNLQESFKVETGIELEMTYLDSGVNEWHGELEEGVNFTLSFYDCYQPTAAFTKLQSKNDTPIYFETFTTTG